MFLAKKKKKSIFFLAVWNCISVSVTKLECLYMKYLGIFVNKFDIIFFLNREITF